MGVLEGSGYEKSGAGSAAAIHYVAEAMRRFYADRSEHLADPDFQRIPVRGVHALGPAWVRITGPAACLEAHRQFADTSAIKVLPEQYASRDELIKETGDQIALLEKQVFTRQHGAGTEFESLSEYRQGDDPRRIDWRTTARHGRPIVRRYQIERNRDVMMGLACQVMTEQFPGTRFEQWISCHHNYVAEETYDGVDVLVTRKGAPLPPAAKLLIDELVRRRS